MYIFYLISEVFVAFLFCNSNNFIYTLFLYYEYFAAGVTGVSLNNGSKLYAMLCVNSIEARNWEFNQQARSFNAKK